MSRINQTKECKTKDSSLRNNFVLEPRDQRFPRSLSLSRSVGRVGENPGNEVENQYACHNLSVWHIFNKQPKFTLAQSKCFPPKHINILDREINSLEQAAFLHKVKVVCFLPIPLFYTGKLTINDGWPLHRTWRTLCMNKHLINNAFVKSRW